MMRWLPVVMCLGCGYRLYSPPTRTLPVEGTRVVGQGQTSLRVGGSGHGIEYADGIGAGSLAVEHGIAPDVDLTAEASFVYFSGESKAATRSDLYLMRGGTKVELSHTIAFVGGVGAAYAPAAGTFVAADGGFVVAWDNCTIVPLASIGAYASAPLAPSEVDLTRPNDEQTRKDTPAFTVGFPLLIGLRIPFERTACLAGQPSRWGLLGGVALTPMSDFDHSDTMLSAGLALEVGL